jgi:hypothetical protein
MKDKLHCDEIFLADKDYFYNLRESGKTDKLDKLTVELLKQVASYVKGYLEYMLIKEG